ncbi:MAG: methyl-accepting chemotaxis protein, partial [Rectinema sp.]|nr:methyl-accepting chemotaxis protein [Rectinema sp.]
MMKNVSIRIKLTMSFGLIFLFMVALGVLSVIFINRQAEQAQRMYERNLRAFELTSSIALNFAKLESSSRSIIDTASLNEAERIHSSVSGLLAEINQALEELKSRLENDAGKNLRESIQLSTEKIETEIKALYNLKKAKKLKEASAHLTSIIEPLLGNVHTLLDELAQRTKNQAKLHYDETIAIRKNTNIVIIIINIIAIAASAVLAFVMSKSITNPISKLVHNLHKATAGDFQGLTFEETKRRDEIGQLIASFAAFLNDFKSQLTTINQTVLHLATSSNEISATSAQLSSSASETAASVTETASTVEEILSLIHI